MKIFHFSDHYRLGVLWESQPRTGERKSVSTCRPRTGLSHRMRYETLAAWLIDQDVKPPKYRARKTPEPLAWQKPRHPVEFENAELGDEG